MKRLLHIGQTLLNGFGLLVLMLSSTALAAQEATLTVQGVLTKADGTAVEDGVYDMTFRLWNDKDASDPNTNLKYVETINDIETVGGVYTVTLGGNGTPLTAKFDEIYWLGVSMNTSNVELLPRPRLTHAPYALGIKGNHNTFPSEGAVIGDAFRAKGGPAQGGLTGNGFAFQAPSGDDAGGMYSDGPNNISLFAGGSHRAKFTNAQNELYGQTVNFGSLISNDFTVNGNALINNVGNNTGNLTVRNFLQVDGSQTINGSLTVQTNQFINAHSNVGGNLTVDGVSLTKGFARAYGRTSGGGFTFYYPNVIDDTDSGLFGGGDGRVEIRANGTLVAEFSPAQGYTNQCCNTLSAIKLFGIQKGPDNPEVEWDEVTGHLQVDNSSRRLKRNILPLTDNYRLILQAEPKLYNRIGYPDEQVELGYIAEEFDSIGLTRLVFYNSNGEITGVNYKKVSIYLTEVVKDHETEIEKMKAEIAALKAQNLALQQANAALETGNTSLQKQQSVFNTQLEALSKRLSALEIGGTGK